MRKSARSRIDEQTESVDAILLRGDEDRRRAVLLRCIDVSTSVDEQTERADAVLLRCDEDGRRAVVRGSIHVSASFDQ